MKPVAPAWMPQACPVDGSTPGCVLHAGPTLRQTACHSLRRRPRPRATLTLALQRCHVTGMDLLGTPCATAPVATPIHWPR